ncbi:MAG: methionyl-tRNA formyltransferase [Acutalibacteraceae bacterium]|jgi:methionyl-tRNA formyltransferase
MNTVFMGTPEFSVPSLERLASDGHSISAVFTQTDKPKGRGNRVTASPVKVFASERGYKIFQPVSLKDNEVVSQIKALEPEIIVVVAYGKILPEEVLEIPKYGCINIHASLLPRYRGAAPIQWALINGDEETGITSMLMDAGLDTGDMLLTEEVKIQSDDTAGTLFERLSKVGAEVLSDTIQGLKDNSIIPVKQDDSKATYAPMLRKSMCVVDWTESACRINNLIRGLTPFLSASTNYEGKNVKLIKAKVIEGAAGDSGRILDSNNRLLVACGGGGALEIEILQIEGKKVLNVSDFLRGNPLEVGSYFI